MGRENRSPHFAAWPLAHDPQPAGISACRRGTLAWADPPSAGNAAGGRADRQRKIAALWPAIDPRTHPGLPDEDPQIKAFAIAIGTPVAARRLWPYTATGIVNAAPRPAPRPDENSSGRVWVPTIEVVGTWDDFVYTEVMAYGNRVQPPSLHRLYQVDGVWHMSGDDDGTQSFMFIATKMGLDPDTVKAMGEGPSYLPTVRQAFDALVTWVENTRSAPPSQTLKPGERLK